MSRDLGFRNSPRNEFVLGNYVFVCSAVLPVYAEMSGPYLLSFRPFQEIQVKCFNILSPVPARRLYFLFRSFRFYLANRADISTTGIYRRGHL